MELFILFVLFIQQLICYLLAAVLHVNVRRSRLYELLCGIFIADADTMMFQANTKLHLFTLCGVLLRTDCFIEMPHTAYNSTAHFTTWSEVNYTSYNFWSHILHPSTRKKKVCIRQSKIYFELVINLE